MADNFQDVAKQFVQFYYQQFDADREQLAPLYRDTSMLTYESESMSGVVPIINKLKVNFLLPSDLDPPSSDSNRATLLLLDDSLDERHCTNKKLLALF